MNTKTILNIKTEKSLKKAAQDIAEEIGIPLGTAINAFLKQFVREREITLSSNKDIPNEYLKRVIKEAEEDYNKGDSSGPFSGKEAIAFLKKL